MDIKNHPIFNHFNRTECVGTGRHVFDFLGVATDVAYKKGWEKHAVKRGSIYTPEYPPVNEHYFDWIALLESVYASSGTFRMAELGAGWAPWLVRAVFAARQMPSIKHLELVAVEADATHYSWIKDHILDNGLKLDEFHLLHGAVAPEPTTVKFPKIANPDVDYGASVRAVTANIDFVEVDGYALDSLLNRFTGPVDFMHLDIQSAEYDVIPPAMDMLKDRVKAIMVGTHLSAEKHESLRALFLKSGWVEKMVFPRHQEIETDFGLVKFGDGFQYWKNNTVLSK